MRSRPESGPCEPLCDAVMESRFDSYPLCAVPVIFVPPPEREEFCATSKMRDRLERLDTGVRRYKYYGER